MPPKKKLSRFTNTPRITTADAKADRFKSVPMLSVRGSEKMHIVNFKDDHIIFNAAFGHYLDQCNVYSLIILRDDTAQEIALRVFNAEEDAAMTDAFWRANARVVLRPNGVSKDKGRRIRVIGLMNDCPWLARLIKSKDVVGSRRYPVWYADLGMYVLQASEP